MNIEEVHEMVSAINRNDQFDFEINEATRVRLHPEGIDVVDGSGAQLIGRIDDVTMIRQLAGTLILWANVKQNMHPENGSEMEALVKFCALLELPQRNHPVNGSRSDWYAKMTRLMSVETLKRNQADLQEIAKYARDERLRDINRALDYIHCELKSREQA